MKTYLALFVAAILSVPVLAQDSQPTFENENSATVDEKLHQALANKNFEIQKSEQGEVVAVKKRTETTTNPDDPEELKLVYNYQNMFNLGMAFGLTIKRSKVPIDYTGVPTSSVMQSLPLDFGIRLPWANLKRLNLGVAYQPRFTQQLPVQATDGGTPDSRGFVTTTRGFEDFVGVFAEYDVVMFPSEQARAVLSLGFQKGLIIGGNGDDNNPNYKYEESGVTAKLRGFLMTNKRLDGIPYIAVKIGNNGVHTVYGGIVWCLGGRLMVKKKIQK